MPRLAFAALLLAAALAPAAQPDPAEALEKARAKFQQDVAKAEEGLTAALEKAQAKAKAAKDKPGADKLAYEAELFGTQRLVPTAVPTAAYLKQRGKAVAALEAAYQPAIKALAKAKKEDEAGKLEDALTDLVKAARGYGPALPDLEARPAVVIENKGTGQALETSNADGTGLLVLGPKAGKKKPSQCWYLDREEKGTVIRNAVSGLAVGVAFGSGDPGAVAMVSRCERGKEAHPDNPFKLADYRRAVTLSHARNDLVFAPVEVKVKAVNVWQIAQDKRESPPAANQLWLISEAK